jgi:hypothetical protein
MTILAVLSGYGAINTPFSFFNVYDVQGIRSNYSHDLLVKNINASAFSNKVLQTLANIREKKIKLIQLEKK